MSAPHIVVIRHPGGKSEVKDFASKKEAMAHGSELRKQGGGSYVSVHSKADAEKFGLDPRKSAVSGLKPPMTSRKAAPTVDASGKAKPIYADKSSILEKAGLSSDRDGPPRDPKSLSYQYAGTGESLFSHDARDASRKAEASGKPEDHQAAAKLHRQAAKGADEKMAAGHTKAAELHEAAAAAKGGGGDNHPRDDHGGFASK